jgi:hypothetical protein
MVDAEDGLEILQQELVDKLLEKGFQPGSDCFRLHDRPPDPLQVGQNGPQALRELVGLIARLADGERGFALLAVGDLGPQFFDGLQVEADLHDQAAESLREILVEARQPLDHEQRSHSHVNGNAKPVFLLFKPPPGEQPAVQLSGKTERLVALLGSERDVGLPDPAASRGDHFWQAAEIIAFIPEAVISAHDVIDGMDDLLGGRKGRRA